MTHALNGSPGGGAAETNGRNDLAPAKAGTIFEMGGEDRSWHGHGRIEVRESFGEGWRWRYLSVAEIQFLIKCLNNR